MSRYETITYQCNQCRETMEFTPKTWGVDTDTRKRRLDTNGWTRERATRWSKSDNHFCPDCNSREKGVFTVVECDTGEAVTTLRAWDHNHARRQLQYDRDEPSPRDHTIEPQEPMPPRSERITAERE